jgi:hypothetical protein
VSRGGICTEATFPRHGGMVSAAEVPVGCRLPLLRRSHPRSLVRLGRTSANSLRLLLIKRACEHWKGTPPLRFKRTLIGAGIIAAGAVLMLGLAAPANAAIPSNPRTIEFDMSTTTTTLGLTPSTAHVILASDSGFQAGLPVTVTIAKTSNGTYANATEGVKIYATGHADPGWSVSDTFQMKAGDPIKLGIIGGDNRGYSVIRPTFTIPTAGSQAIDMDYTVVTNTPSADPAAVHLKLTSDNMFQPGSTTTATMNVVNAANGMQVSGDGTSWGSSYTATVAVGQSLPTMTQHVIGFNNFMYTATLSGLTVPPLPLPAAATPVVNPPVIDNDAGTITYTGTGTPGDTITVRDANGNTIGTATVDSSGNWTTTMTNPPAGAGTIVQTGPGQVESADTPITLPEIVGTPIVDPFIAGGTALAALAAAGTLMLLRRRKAASQA